MGRRKPEKKTSKDPESPEVEVVTEKLSVSVKEHVRRLSGTAEPPPASFISNSSSPNPLAKGMDLLAVANIQKDALDEGENKLKDALSELDINNDEVEYLWDHYQGLHQLYSDAITELMESEKAAGKIGDYRGSVTELGNYTLQLHKYARKVQKLLGTSAKPEPAKQGGESSNQPESSIRMILPKRQLPKFTGDIREWLSFSAAFEEIHDDKTLSDTDKFHFLLQSTVDGSPARKLLQSYPFTAANYKSAVKSLQDRFGRTTTLIKVYVRDLLQLVIGASTGQKIEFSDLVTSITSQIRNLATLGVTQDKCSLVLYPVVESCLPFGVLQAWQRNPAYKEDLDDLLNFLQQEVNALEDRKLANFTFGTNKQEKGNKDPKPPNTKKKTGGDVPTTSTFVTGASRAPSQGGNTRPTRSNCIFCGWSHSPLGCRKALDMPLSSKNDILKKNGYCTLCVRKVEHTIQECSSTPRCNICTKKHHLVLCPSLKQSGANVTRHSTLPASEVTPASEDCGNVPQLSNTFGTPEVPMQTLVVTIHGTNGKSRNVRMMIDTGSARSYIRSDVADELKLTNVGEESVVHELFGARETQQITYKKVKAIVSDTSYNDKCMFDCSVISDIANNVHFPQPGPWLEEFQRRGIVFSDIASVSSRVDMLIGNDVAPRVYTDSKMLLKGGPAAMETRWGWVLSGKLPQTQKVNQCQSVTLSTSPGIESSNTILTPTMMQIANMPLSALWELEAIGISDPVEDSSKQELAASTQKHFEETVQQLTDGRYQVALPWITGCKDKLLSNFLAADRRLRNVTKDLQVKGYLEKYDELFKLWEAEEMIEEVPSSELNRIGHYLPHRPVLKLSSATTPIRPVFDGSAKARGKLSLNDCLDKGPNLLELIPPILTRFRMKKVGITADIKKAFQQISIAPTDRDYMRFLWWKDLSTKEVKVYRHARVVFGVTCSPYLLGATIHHHLKQALEQDVAASKLILKSMYVDNVLLSLDSWDEAKEFQEKAVSLLAPAQFDLRAWEFGPTENERVIPVLGLVWKTGKDALSFDIDDILKDKLTDVPTLRHVLSLVHSIYDPLGFASPFVIVGKLLLRRCHDAKVGLDTPVDPVLKADVLKWAAQIPLLAQIEVPRHVCFGKSAQYSLHVLCDSSSLATAAAVFLRVEDGGIVKVFLLYSKARVAPKTKATIPRLETVACVIGSRLLCTVLADMGISREDCSITLWSDSSTALAWIRGSGPWGVFVTNRVKEIREKVGVSCWRHIPGKENLADLPSRGCSAQKLLESKWWNGPSWLYLPPEQWPFSELPPEVELVDGERKKIVAVATANSSNSHIITKFLRISSYPRILQSISIWLHLKKMLRNQVIEEDYRSASALKEAETHLLLFVQQDFVREPKRLEHLNPFKDDQKLLRTKTRLTLEDNDESFQCPILLPDNNEFVMRMIRWEHELNCHVGATSLLATLRERFWIVNGRRTVRSVITRCWICKRFNSSRICAPVAPLPKSRTMLQAPFHVTGVDAAGPLILKGGEKVWVYLFTCATYRAVHLELVDTLSSDGVIRALRKFIARRGRPSILYSDNALGFTGAARYLLKSQQQKILDYANVSKLLWRFNPPLSPWWGGFWERLIGLAKQLLRRILGKRVVHRWELDVLLVEVEECLNNRPLTYTSENVEDPIPLTPNHFIRWSGNLFFPEADLHDAASRRAALKKMQHLREALRSRFRKEYLGLLRGSHQAKTPTQLQVGDVVLVERENVKRQDWPLGVIVEAIPGRDGVSRLFRLKTNNGVILRPAQRLFMMEQEN